MKYILFLLIICFSGCSISHPNDGNISENEWVSNVVFVWKNSWNWAIYNIIISCKDMNPPQWLHDISENETVEIILMENCKNQKIPKEILDTLTSKKFYYVYWDFYFQGNQIDNKIYKLDNEEAMKIWQAPWKIQAIEWISHEQAKIIRNTNNPIREAFEPTGNRNFYTEEDAKICDIYWKWSEFMQDEQIWRTYADKVLRCYRDLPPMK